MKKVFFLIFLIFLMPFEASAAGILLTSDSSGNWKLVTPKAQYCYINYSKNIQKMILDISFIENIESNMSLWIVPVPGIKKNVNVDYIKSSPYLHGKYIVKKITGNMNSWHNLILLSQLYLAPFIIKTGPGTRMELFGTPPIIQDNKYKISTNIININELSSFMNTNKINISPSLLTSISSYDDNYVLLVFQITVPEIFRRSHVQKDLNNNHLSAYVKFKTEKMFYPLKISTVYGKHIIPIEITVINIVDADLNNIVSHKNYFSGERVIDYHYLSNFDVKTDCIDFFNEQYYPMLYYSKILIKSESQGFVSDLSFNDNKPENIKSMIFINDYIHLIYLSIFIIASCLSSFIATRICYRDSAPSFFKTLLLGLLNFTTIIGVWLFSSRITNDKNNKSVISFIMMFSIIFIILTEIANIIVFNQLLIK